MAWFRTSGNNGGSLKVKTASGDIASFETNLVAPLHSVLVDVVASGGNGTPDNPIPIVGYSSANITRCGVNLFNCDSKLSATAAHVVYTSDDNYIYMNGTKSGGTYAPFTSSLYFLKKGTYYTKAFFISGTATNDPQLSFILPDGSATGNIVNGATFTLSEDSTVYPRFAIWTDNTVFTNLKIGIVISTASISEYSEYNGQTYTIAFGQTVYGGVLDVTRGKLHVTWEGADMGSLNWQIVDFQGINYKVSHSLASTIKAPTSSSKKANILCPIFKNVSRNELVNFNYLICVDPNKNIDIIDNDYSTASDFTTAMSGVILAYELATPFDIDLTPVQVRALVGDNNVFADCGNSEVEFVNKASDESAMICSTGGQSITLPVKASEHLTFKFDLYFLYGNGDFCLMADVWSGSGWLVHTRYWDLAFRYDAGGGSHVFPITPYTKKSIEVNTFDGTLIIDGEVKTTGHTVSYTSGEYIRMFGMNASNSCMASVGVVDVYKDDVLYMHLVPKKNENTGEGYYYDTIGGQSYYSETANPLIYAEM